MSNRIHPADRTPIVVLEGVDGAGKSSQAKVVAATLRAAGVRVAEPTRDPRRRIRALYKNLISEIADFPSPETSVFLGLSDYADALDRSGSDPCDVRLFERYCYSAIADGITLGMDPKKAASLARFFPDPLVTLFIDLDAELALARKGECTLAEAGGPDYTSAHQAIEESFISYQEGVRNAYRFLGETGAIANLVVIDGSLAFDEVTNSILSALSPFLNARIAA
ncbi:hypothetical protein ABT389_08095 [Streptomyces bacillaris]|uniref:dTMP kinase n=1 Tax=Streptomyces bacillaris TaxID=68179 RepID=UPI003361614A